MFALKRSLVLALALALSSFAVALSGCATVDQRADILYQPTAAAKGGSGDLYLVRQVPGAPKTAMTIQYVIGKITKDGAKVGNVVTDMAPADLVMDALREELRSAGYRVTVTDAMPADAKKGVSLNNASIVLDVKKSIVKDEANGSAKISVQIWRDGRAVNALDYESEYSDVAVADRERLASKTLRKMLEMVMMRSIPDMVQKIEAQ